MTVASPICGWGRTSSALPGGKLAGPKWSHFVVVVGYYNNIGYNTGYLDGEEIFDRHYNFANAFTAEFFKDAVMHESLFLGKGFWNKEIHYFDGKIDDLRIYDRPLTTEEVVLLYNLK